MSLRLVFMGTGHFALPTFLGLYETSHEVVGLFTQPDRTGRGHHRHVNPLKKVALERGTPVFQPENINREESLADLRSLDADLAVVAAYGQILSAKLLEIPRRGAINLHASLLPKYRGAAPVQYAIWKGEEETGVTIFQIQPKLDAGPILGMENTEIKPGTTAGELELLLAELSVPLAVRVIDKLEAGVAEGIIQDPNLVTLAPRLTKADGEVDWNQTTAAIQCHLRAMQPWPKPYGYLQPQDGKRTRMLILEIQPVEEWPEDCEPTDAETLTPGTIFFADRKRVLVKTADGVADLVTIQPEGKRAMPVADFLCGHSLQPGDKLVRNAEVSQ